jgi:hypothetical protein
MKTTSETPKQTHAEFLASLRDAHNQGRPIAYFRQWPVEYLIEAGLPPDWLKKCGLIQPDGSAAKLPSQCSQRGFAAIATRLYGKPVNQAAISRAVRKEGLAVAVTPSNGRLNTDVALRWWEAQKIGSATEVDAKAARQNIACEREALELAAIKRREKKETGELISMAVVQNYIAGIGSRIAGHTDKLIEDKPGLRAIVRAAGLSLGISEETLNQLDSRLAVDFVTANDALKSEFKVISEAARKHIDEVQAEQIKKELSR